MKFPADILKAKHVGIRGFKEHVSRSALNDLLVVTDRGQPVSVNVPYAEILDLIDFIDEITDIQTVQTVIEAKRAISSGLQGIPASQLFCKLRRKRK